MRQWWVNVLLQDLWLENITVVDTIFIANPLVGQQTGLETLFIARPPDDFASLVAIAKDLRHGAGTGQSYQLHPSSTHQSNIGHMPSSARNQSYHCGYKSIYQNIFPKLFCNTHP